MNEELLDELDVNVLDVPNDPDEDLGDAGKSSSPGGGDITDGTSNT